MPRRWHPLSDRIARDNREVDRVTREVIDEAIAKRNLGYEHRGYPLHTKGRHEKP